MKADRQNVLARHLAGSLRDARRNYRRRLRRCQNFFSEKAVHDLRVESRRLLALLDFLQAARLAGAPGRTRKLLKRRLDAFDELRDTQVQLQQLKPLWSEFPEVKPLRKLLRRREQRLIKQARKNVAHTKGRQLSARLKKLEQEMGTLRPAGSPADDGNLAMVTLKKSFNRAASLRQRIRGSDAAAIHQLRVAFKRFRYMSELLQPFLPWLAKAQLRGMRKFQAAAGNIQDLEVLLATLKGFVRKRNCRRPH